MSGTRVLLVEDNPTTRKLVCFTLRSQGIEVVEAPDAAAALAAFAEGNIALVLQDLLLPDMDGMELVLRLRALPHGPDVPILAFSGLLSEGDEARISAAGFDDLVPKPVEPSTLLALVRTRLADRQEPGDAAAPGAGRRLLLVDDDAVQRRLAEFRLRQRGFEVATAADGAEALERARARIPDVIVSDVLMPRMDGFELCMAVRKDPALARVRIVLATNNYVEPADREFARSAGADDLVLRTPDLDAVLAALDAVLAAGRRAPPAATTPEDPELEREHARRVLSQLERQVAINAGAARRNSLLAAEIALLNGVSQALATNESLEDALEQALAACFDAAAISTGALFVMDDGETRVIGFGDTESWGDDLAEYLGSPGARDILERGAVLQLPGEGAPEPLASEVLRRSGAAAAFLVPLSHRNELLGALLVASEGAESSNADRLAFAEAVTGQIGQALALRKVFAELETSERAAREKAEALRTSEERFRILARATADTLWDWDLRTGEIWRSEGMTRQLGYAAGSIGPTIESITEHVHPDDRERTLAGLRSVIDGGQERWEGSYRLHRPDGSWALVADRGFVVRDEHGAAVRMVGGMTDRTEHHLAQQRIAEQASLLDQARDAIIVHDLDHTVTFWNRGAERLYGWSAGEAVGRSIVELIHTDGEAFVAASQALLEHGEWAGELEQTRKDGSSITVEARWTLVRDAAGAGRVMSINTDVTEQRRLQQQFLRTQRLESIGTLAGGIAHDLNNVLSPIMMCIAMLRDATRDAESRELLTTIEESTARGAALVRQVLAFARGVEGARTAVDLGRVVQDIAKIVRDTFPKGITFLPEMDGRLWHVEADPTQVHQILLNLCVNARDAMPNGGVLRVGAENLDIDESYAAMSHHAVKGRYVCLKVVDTGQGIPADVIERIFDPFFSTKEVGKGTGLGLSTVDGIVRSHGGFVAVESEPGRGTTFRVYLPATLQRAPEETPTTEGDPPRGNGELVLVVDDEAAIRTIARQTLETFGYRAITAVDGADALATYARRGEEVAVVLTDLRMPIMDGTALIQALRRIDPGVRVIASGGLDAEGGEEQLASVGVSRFLPKPYTAQRLLDALAEALRDTPAPGTSGPMDGDAIP